MIYRPNFCCNCGEKIERSQWKLWTSGRFCELCETDHKLADVGPKLLAAGGILAGIVGIGSYLQRPQYSEDADLKRGLISKTTTQKNPKAANISATSETPEQSQPNPANSAANVSISQTEVVPKSIDSRTKTAAEPVYHCGAMTKKGTPCSRRVKQRSERCWQHTGRPAMAEVEKTGNER